jgi:DNA primase
MLHLDANVVVVEGTLDALAIAAQAARKGQSAKYAPVAASGVRLSDVRLSDDQLDGLLALHPKAPVLAADGDPAARDANLEWAARFAFHHRESVVTARPEVRDPDGRKFPHLSPPCLVPKRL